MIEAIEVLFPVLEGKERISCAQLSSAFQLPESSGWDTTSLMARVKLAAHAFLADLGMNLIIAPSPGRHSKPLVEALEDMTSQFGSTESGVIRSCTEEGDIDRSA